MHSNNPGGRADAPIEPSAHPFEPRADSSLDAGRAAGGTDPKRDELPDHSTYAAVEDLDVLDVDPGQLDDH